MTEFHTLSPEQLQQQLGNIDIYLLDQILKGRFEKGMRILDAGCGGGRNLVYLMQAGYDVYGVDSNFEAIDHIRSQAFRFAPTIPAENFRTEAIDDMSFPKAHFHIVLSNAVLHFAKDQAHFKQLVTSMWNALVPGGLFFVRLATSIGLEDKIAEVENQKGWYHLPDGSQRFLADQALLLEVTSKLKAEMIEPLKTVNVQNQRCMTTWVLRKNPHF